MQKRRLPEFEYDSMVPTEMSEQLQRMQHEINLLKQQQKGFEGKSFHSSENKAGGSIDPQQMESALNDWLSKIETHIN